MFRYLLMVTASYGSPHWWIDFAVCAPPLNSLFFPAVVIRAGYPPRMRKKAVLVCRPLNRKEVCAERDVFHFLSSSAAAVNRSTLM